MHAKMRLCSLLVTVAALASGGCNEQRAMVTGTVTLDGEPLAIGPSQRGTVLFQPIDSGPVATGLIDQHGTFRISTGADVGLLPGKYAVTVRAVEVVPATEETVEPTGRPLTPSVYANPEESGFTFEISPGENTCDLALRSDAGPTAVPKPIGEESEPDDEQQSNGEDTQHGETESSNQVTAPQ